MMNTTSSNSNMPAAIQELGQQLYHSHHKYKESALRHRRFRHRDIVPLIERLQEQSASKCRWPATRCRVVRSI
ncbi:hypothetical protein [Pontibacter sp. BAB1700]|uniref:hypothetical protein n=1 Tax=Pontibacter sp. BAB1700 TaxID=1144253 RepID=UPI001ED8FFE8|nr:hypothetical protein [Pontibacter sp. BAB1700]